MADIADAAPDKPAQPDTAHIQSWLAEHPGDPRAGAVREKLKSMGVNAPDPNSLPDYLGAFIQGTLLDPAEKVGQMAEHAPGWLGRTSRSIGASLPQGLQDYLTEHQQMGERHPFVRLGGNLTGALMLPGGSKTLAGDAVIGTTGGLMQPLDPNDPHYWRDVGLQGLLGGTLGTSLGAVSRAIAGKASDASRAALNVFQRIYNEMGLSQHAPKAITPQTASQVRQTVGQRLGQIYRYMHFNPMDPAWRAKADQIYRDVYSAITDPKLRERWHSVFMNEAAKPAFQAESGRIGAPITGDKLHQLVSSLGGEAANFGQEAAKGGADAKVWNIMAKGLHELTDTIERQIDQAVPPAIGAARRAANRAYQLADGMFRSSGARNRWTPSATDIAATLERKMGKTQYAGPRFGRVKGMLEKERDIAAQKPGLAARLGSHAGRIPGMIAGAEVGRRLGGHELAGMMLGGEITQAGAKLLPGAAARVGRRPGLAGAAAGQGVRGEELLVTPKGAKWQPEEDK